ncbi:diacylglycerol/lipid kinase family protein [Metamycoplasma buccale]|uniref:diacylglycerol/lipid kinase family protein n=1 Tax=Metamycoplasma buccale TaxID=55602 RepID=UPI00398F177B
MLYIFYNSLSKIGTKKKKIFNILNKAVKTFNHNELHLNDIINIKDPYKIIKELDQEKDVVLLVGGDGTLTNIANKICGLKNLPPIYAYKAGTGNDFLRSLKTIKETKIVNKHFYLINPYIEKLPIIKFNNNKMHFLNGIGLGIDAVISRDINEKKLTKNKVSFFKISVQNLKTFQPIKNIEIIIDDKFYKFNNVWFCSIMNGEYYGGGMKIAPNANRLGDTLKIIVINEISKFKLLYLFPLVYTGKHINVSNVKILEGKKITLKTSEKTSLQIDGESFNDIDLVNVEK